MAVSDHSNEELWASAFKRAISFTTCAYKSAHKNAVEDICFSIRKKTRTEMSTWSDLEQIKF